MKKITIYVILFLVLSFFLIGCNILFQNDDSTTPNTDDVSHDYVTNVDSKGMLINYENGLILEIPDGSLSNYKEISVSNAIPPEINMSDTIEGLFYAEFISKAYKLNPDSNEYSDFVRLTIPFNEGIEDGKILIPTYWDGSVWRFADGYYDKENGTIVVETEHHSVVTALSLAAGSLLFHAGFEVVRQHVQSKWVDYANGELDKEENNVIKQLNGISHTINTGRSPYEETTNSYIEVTEPPVIAESLKVESVQKPDDLDPPNLPHIVSPGYGESFEVRPDNFDWTSVEDESGVMYELVIYNRMNTTNPVLHYKGITSSFFSLSNPQGEDVINNGISQITSPGSYIWKVRAVDGKGNRSRYKRGLYTVRNSTHDISFNLPSSTQSGIVEFDVTISGLSQKTDLVLGYQNKERSGIGWDGYMQLSSASSGSIKNIGSSRCILSEVNNGTYTLSWDSSDLFRDETGSVRVGVAIGEDQSGGYFFSELISINNIPPEDGNPDLCTHSINMEKTSTNESLTGDKPVDINQPFNISLTIANDGTGDAESFRVGIYASSDLNISSSEDKLIGSKVVEGVAKNSTTDFVDISCSFTDDLSAGRYYIVGIINDQNSITELTISNNTFSSQFFYKDLGGNSNAIYTVTFDTNGGNTIDVVTVKTGNKIGEPVVPTRDGYIFNGWYKDSEFTDAWNFDFDEVLNNITLYANWEEENIRRLTLSSTTANGETKTVQAPSYTVTAGETIDGSFTVGYEHNMPSSNVLPLAVTPDWGDKTSVYWEAVSDMSDGGSYTETFSLTAPATPGTYHLILANHSEYTAAQILSATHHTDSSVTWDDGNDLYDLTDSQLATAQADGMLLLEQLAGGTYSNKVYGVTAIEFVVEESSSEDSSLGVNINLTSPNNYNVDFGTFDGTLTKPSETASLDITMVTGSYGYECSWNIEDSGGNVVASGDGYDNNNTYTSSVDVPQGSYTLNMSDSFGDGWHGGYISISVGNNEVVSVATISYGHSNSVDFDASGNAETIDVTANVDGGAESFEWYLDGTQVDGATGSTYALDSATIAVGLHELTAFVTKDGRLYSGSLDFTVEN